MLAAAVGSAIEMAILYVPFNDPTRVYDGTDTRAFALLIGAALALAWPRDLRIANLTGSARRALDFAGGIALIGILVLFCATSEYETFLYRGGMVLCAVLSAVVIAVTIHPDTHFARLLVWRHFAGSVGVLTGSTSGAIPSSFSRRQATKVPARSEPPSTSRSRSASRRCRGTTSKNPFAMAHSKDSFDAREDGRSPI